MENAAKRKFMGRETYQPQYNYHNQKLLVDNSTNTECLKPMMLNAWTQTDSDDFRFKQSQQHLVDNLQERIRKLEEMFQIHSIALNENQTNQQVSNTSTTNCINGKTIQSHLSNKRSPSKSRHPEKTTYKIVAGPAGMEIIEPIEVEYAEEDGTYLDHDLNTSNDSNRLEICIPKEEYTTNNDQQHQHNNIEHISQQQQQQQQSHLQTCSIQDYQHQQPTTMQQQQHQTIQLQTSSGQHIQTIPNLHNSHSSSQLYHTQITDSYHTITQTQSQPQQQPQHQQQSQQDNNIRNLQYISVVHPNINGTSNGHVQQPQNVIIGTQHTQQSSISPMSTSSTKSTQRQRLKSDVRYYTSQESLHSSNSAPEISNEVTVPAVSSSFAEIKKEFINRDESNDSRRSNIESNFHTQQLNDIEVSLGPNNTRISAAVYESIDWTSVTSATRKLLITIFDRETLATHTMTGKPSPAFKGRDLPSKHQLNPQAVQDIIFAVSRKCNVAEKEVRTAITTKCADENKMLKQREKKRRSLQESNKENFSKNDVITGH